MSLTIVFAILAGVSAAGYSIFQKLGSTSIHAALGAMIISATAFLVNFLIVLFAKYKGQEILFTTKGLLLLIIVGIAAAGIDFFSLLAFSKGLKVTSSFIISGVQAGIILTVGFLLLKEPLNFTKIGALVLIVSGIMILQKFSP